MQMQELQGIVLCAGLGTRLRPLTSIIPKPAVPVGPLPAALRNIEQMLQSGLTIVHCNTHYLANELESELRAACRSRSISEDRIRFWNEPDLLETGGGIARIVHALASESGRTEIPDTMVVSGDIVADIPIQEMNDLWNKRLAQSKALMVSLPLDKPRKDVTWVDLAQERVRGFGMDFDSSAASAHGLTARVFSNHQILSGEILKRQGVERKSSIDLFYRSALRKGEEILHLPWKLDAHWFDIGTPSSYLHCASLLKQPMNPCLSQGNLGRISLCLPVSDVAQSDHTHVPGMISQDELSSGLNRFAQICLDKTHQSIQWCWLGELHALPGPLATALEIVGSSLDADADAVLRKGKGKSSQGDYFLRTVDASFLARAGNWDEIQLGPSGFDNCEGFLTAQLPSTPASLTQLQSPLLMSLDLILGIASRAPHGSLKKETLSPFWILFIPPKL